MNLVFNVLVNVALSYVQTYVIQCLEKKIRWQMMKTHKVLVLKGFTSKFLEIYSYVVRQMHMKGKLTRKNKNYYIKV